MVHQHKNAGCGYAYLDRSDCMQRGHKAAPQGVMIVPSYQGISYDALTHGLRQPGCSGYFSFKNAYGGADPCSQKYHMLKHSC